jgi:anti-sigma B factor antagonist
MSISPAAVTSRADESPAAIRIAGALDATTRRALRAMVDEHLLLGRRFLRIDLSGLTTIDRPGLALLRDIHDRLLALRGTLVLIAAGPAVMASVRAAGLDGVLLMLEPFASDPWAG